MNSNRNLEEWQGSLIDDPTFLKKAIGNFLQKILNEEFDSHINAEPFERSPHRKGYRNGSYTRGLKTRVGTISLNVCRDRDGEFRPELFDRYQRSEKSLVLGIMEMYLHGVSTRKVEEVIEPLCGYGISKSHVSNLCKDLDTDIRQWRNRSLDQPYPYLILDARYEKVRDGGKIVSKAFVVAIGISEEGVREILGTWVIQSESLEGWNACFAELKERRLHGVRYIVSDQNKGLRGAIDRFFQGAVWQRCQVHFMRNFISKLSKSQQKEGIQLLKEVFSAHSKKSALNRLKELEAFLVLNKKEGVLDWLNENIEECLGVYDLPENHRKKMKSTNMLERFNQELKRRSRAIRVFPNEESCIRILTALCMEQSEAWSHRQYLDMTE